MTEESERDLVKRAEAALAGLSLTEPDWDGISGRIESSLATPPEENAALFDAPLPATNEEGSGVPTETTATAPEAPAPVITAASDAGPTISLAPEASDEVDDEEWASAPEAADEPPAQGAAGIVAASSPPSALDMLEPRRDSGVSLADLARASVARRGSEATNIAKESLAVASQSRAQGDQVAQRVQAASIPPQAPRSVAPPAPSSRNVATVPPTARGGNVLKGPWVGVVIAGIGLAAGFGLYVSGQRNNPAPVAVIEPAPQIPVAERAAPAPAPAPVAKVEPAPVAEPAPSPQATLDPSSLPTLPREAATHAEPKAGGAVAKTPVPASSPASPGKVAAEKIVLDEDQKVAPKAAPSAPRPADGKLRPAELSSDTMTDRPSAGAAQAAVGAVLGAARACVAGHPQPSNAQIVFGSDGQVQNVTVGGAAAGTPAAGCIETALKKARVQPFAASSFSLGVTVRPP